jgi:hypothetical protein
MLSYHSSVCTLIDFFQFSEFSLQPLDLNFGFIHILHAKEPVNFSKIREIPTKSLCCSLLLLVDRAGPKAQAVHADAWGCTILGAAHFRIRPYINIDCPFAR